MEAREIVDSEEKRSISRIDRDEFLQPTGTCDGEKNREGEKNQTLSARRDGSVGAAGSTD